MREVFEFVEGEADLSIETDGQAEVSDADIAALLSQALSGAPAAEPEAPSQTIAEPATPQMQALPETTSPEPASTPAPAAEIAKAESKTAAVVPTQTTIRVELDRVDRLINLVGELVINQAMLSQRVIEANFAARPRS